MYSSGSRSEPFNSQAQASLIVSSATGLAPVVKIFTGRDAAELRDLAILVTKTPGKFVIFALAGPKSTLICARSDERQEDMRKALQAICDTMGGGRGGGRPEFAQGGGISATVSALESAITKALCL